MYSTGITSKVSRVALVRPPITVMARGPCTSAPSPMPSARGTSPSTVVAVVMRMGRIRRRPALRTAASRSSPSSRRRLIASTRTMALLTTTPASTMTPMRTTTEMAEPVTARPATVPTRARGTVSRMTKGWSRFSKMLAMMT